MRMTSRAVAAVRELIALNLQDMDEPDLVPLVAWMDDDEGEATNSGPMLAMIERRKVASPDVDRFSDGELAIYNGLPKDLALKFANHTLDYRDKRFEFVLE